MDILRSRAEIDTVNASEWAGFLEGFEDANIYQSWSYGAVRWGEPNLSHLILRRDKVVVGMAQLRIVSVPFLRAGVAYLRWGPVCQLRGSEPDVQIWSRMALALREEYVQRRHLCLRVLPSVIDGSPQARIFHDAFRQYRAAPVNKESLQRTFLLDLSPPLEELRKRLDQKWRNQLNRAEKNGLEIRQGYDRDSYESFVSIYRQMWARKKFKEGVDVNEFARIQHSLPPGQRLMVWLCLEHGGVVAGIVCSAMGDTGIYLLGATSDSGLKAKGAFLLQWTMIKWLKENGYGFYDLGGIDPESNPGVYHFKSGFSGRDVRRIHPVECGESFSSLMAIKAADFIRGGIPGKLAEVVSSAWKRSMAGTAQRG